MNCYKCDTTEDLSAKKMNRDGTILFICKPCRNQAAKLLRYRVATTPSRVSANPISREWIALAKEKNGLIAAKYRDDSFLESRGLL